MRATLPCGGMTDPAAIPARPPSYGRVSLGVVMSAREANLLGNIHGGEIVKLADSTAGAVAQRHSGGPAVTAALDEMAFLEPVHVGDIVRTYAQVNWAGRSSMEVGVRVETQPWNDPSTVTLHVASAYFVFVAIDADGRARPVPPLAPGDRGGGTPDARGRDPPRPPAGPQGGDRGGAEPPVTSATGATRTTARLWLDLPTEADVDDLHAIHSDPESWRHFPVGRHTSRTESEEMVTQAEEQFVRNGLGYWSIRDRPDGPVVGRGGCTILTGRMWWNLYYRFATAVHGRGYATEMGLRAIEAARDVEPDRPVLAYLLEHNAASRRTAERLGMQLAWRGPDRPNPDHDAIRLVYVDREPTDELVAAIEDHALG